MGLVVGGESLNLESLGMEQVIEHCFQSNPEMCLPTPHAPFWPRWIENGGGLLCVCARLSIHLGYRYVK